MSCAMKYAKDQDKYDQLSLNGKDCNQTASRSFENTWHKLENKVLDCPADSWEVIETTIMDCHSDIAHSIFSQVVLAYKYDRKLAISLLNTAKNYGDRLLNAEIKNIKKEDKEKLSKAAGMANLKFANSWQAAILKAERNGVDIGFISGVADYVKTDVDDLIDDLLEAIVQDI